MEFRVLDKDDIEVRVQSITKKNGQPTGVILLLYKNARVDMNILDETVGAEKWQREHYECKGNLFCRVGIKCGDEWVWKSDCGIKSNQDAQKGEASDSFKRACFNWGIGRELYSSPFIWIPADECNIEQSTFNGKTVHKCNDKFSIEKIAFDKDKKCIGVAIKNDTAKQRCFVWKKGE